MARKRILILCLILNLLFIWGNSLLPREVSARLSDRVMDVMNVAAEKLNTQRLVRLNTRTETRRLSITTTAKNALCLNMKLRLLHSLARTAERA